MKTKQEMLEAVRLLESSLDHLSPENSASRFSQSIDWHPRWPILSNCIERVKEDYEWISCRIEAILQEIKKGKGTHTKHCHGGGWTWDSVEVEIEGKRVKVTKEHSWDYAPTWGVTGIAVYHGQHTRPLYILDDSQKAFLGQTKK
jgi:hypothetical protein